MAGEIETKSENWIVDLFAGSCAIGPMDCSLMEFARGVKYFIDEESRGFRCDTHLLNILRRAACLAWEHQRLFNYHLPDATLVAEVDRLRQALRDHGEHESHCKSRERYPSPPCDCVLAQFLNPVAQEHEI